MDSHEHPSRRRFMAISAASMAALTGNTEPALQAADEEGESFQAAAFLIGPESAIPDPDSAFFDDKSRYHYLYFAIDGGRHEIKDDGTGWTELNVSAPRLEIGTNTELFESDEGSTVLQNTADNPINIQLYPSGRAFFVGNDSTETVIDVQDEWYEIAGPWDSAHMNFLAAEGDGGLTYEGDVTSQVQYNVSGTYTSPSNNATYEIGLFKDDTLKSRTTIDFSPPRQDESLSLPTIVGFTDTTTTGMTHTPKVRCTSGASNITVNGINFTLRG